MKACPNYSHPDWKNLVAAVGEDEAHIIFVENGNQIPASATNILKTGNYNKITDLVENSDTVANEMIEQLVEVFPLLNLTQHGAFNEEGKFVPSEDNRGIHIRPIMSSALAWANNETLDKPPYQYAKDFLYLYENHPLVQQILQKYGEETFLKNVERFYDGKKMSDSFNEALNDFWSVIKNDFRNYKVLNVVTQKYYKGEYQTNRDQTSNGNVKDLLDKTKKAVKKRLKQLKIFDKEGIDIEEIQIPTMSEIKQKIFDALWNKKILDEKNTKYAQKKKLKKTITKAQAIETINSLIAKQGQIQKPEEGAEDNRYKDTQTDSYLDRVSNIVNPDLVIDPMWEGALNIGNSVDSIIRKYFLGTDIKYSDYKEYMSKEAFDELMKSVNEFRKQLDENGITLYTGWIDENGNEREISVWDNELGIAGTVDVIAINENGDIMIWDMKTMRNMDLNDVMIDGQTRRQKHGLQLSIYKELFEKMTDTAIADVSILPIQVKYPPGGTKTTTAYIPGSFYDVDVKPISAITGEKLTDVAELYNFNLDAFKAFVYESVFKINELTKQMFDETSAKNYAELDDRLLKDLIKFIESNDKGANRLLGYLAGDTSIELTKTEKKALSMLEQIFLKADHYSQIYNKYIDENGFVIDKEVVNTQSNSEIQTARETSNKNISRNPVIKFLGKQLNKVLQYVTNSRLLSKYISGSEKSVLSNFVYKTIERAQNDFHEMMLNVQDAIGEIDKKLQMGSKHFIGRDDVSKMTTEKFSLTVYEKAENRNDKDYKPTTKDIQLTIAEMLTIYSFMQQEDLLEEIKEYGFTLEQLDNRDTKIYQVFKLSNEELNRLKETVENDSTLFEMTLRTKEAFKVIREGVNTRLKVLEGFEMDNLPDYFPVSYGYFKDDLHLKIPSIDDLSFARARLGGNGVPLKINDYFQAINNQKVAASNYYGYALPLRNALRIIKESKINSPDKQTKEWLNELEDILMKYNNPSSMFMSRGEQKANKFFNKIQGNYAVAALAKNLGVVMKQQVSLQTASMYIDNKYLAQSGESIGPLAFISPIKLFKLLNITGFKGGDTKLPIEWGNLRDSPLLREMMEIPAVRARLQGVNSIEIGEAVLGKNIGEDNINLTKMTGFKNKDGSDILVSKSRLMKSITLMDSLTIMRLYEAAKLETAEQNPGMSEQEQKEISQERLLELIALTQPTFDYSNRTGLANLNNPLAKSLTMFTSATQKVQMILIDKIIDVVHNPNKANIKSLTYAVFNVGILSAALLTSIDLLRAGIVYGFDDDDEWYKDYYYSGIRSTLGTVHGLGIITNQLLDEYQNKPWRSVVQTPHEALIQDAVDVTKNIFKGDLEKFLIDGVSVSSQMVGLPRSPIKQTTSIAKRVLSENDK